MSESWLWDRLIGHPGHEDVPRTAPTLAACGKLLLDVGLFQVISRTAPAFWVKDGEVDSEVRYELDEAHELYVDRGWLAEPETFHGEPPPLENPVIKSMRPYRCEHMRFRSEYEPDAEDPAIDRWLDYGANRTAHAWVLRHRDDKPRPWLVVIHGFGMGSPWMDLPGLRLYDLHKKHGVNIVSYVMPLHGPRRGNNPRHEVFGRGIANLVHTEANAMWDLRRIIGWIDREYGDTPIGAYGISLGGYTTALLAGLEQRLDFAVAGVPATCFVELFVRNLPPQDGEKLGDFWERAATTLNVISPLAMSPKVPHDGRYIFGGVLDRLIPVDAVRELWLHWEQPRIEWFNGSHISFMRETAVENLLAEAIEGRGTGHRVPGTA